MSFGNNIELTKRMELFTYNDLFQIQINNLERADIVIQYYAYASNRGQILNVSSNVISLNAGPNRLNLSEFLMLNTNSFRLEDTLPEDQYNIRIQVLLYPSYQLSFSMNENIVLDRDKLADNKQLNFQSTSIYTEGNFDQFSSSQRLFYNNYIRGGVNTKIDVMGLPFNLSAGTLYQFDDNSFMLDKIAVEFDYLKYIEKMRKQALSYIDSSNINELRARYDSITGLDKITDWEHYEVKSVVESYQNYSNTIDEIKKTEYAKYFDTYEKYKGDLNNETIGAFSKYANFLNNEKGSYQIDTSAILAKYGAINNDEIDKIQKLAKDEELVNFLKKYNNKQQFTEFQKIHARYKSVTDAVAGYKEKYTFIKDGTIKKYESLRDKDDLKKMIQTSEDLSFIKKFTKTSYGFDFSDFKEIKLGFFYPDQENTNYSISTPLLGYSVVYNKAPWILTSYFGSSKVLNSGINKFYREAFKNSGAYQGEIGVGIGDINKKSLIVNYTLINRDDSTGVRKNLHLLGIKAKLNCPDNVCSIGITYDYWMNSHQHNVKTNSSLGLNNSFRLKRILLNQIILYKGSDIFLPSLFLYKNFAIFRSNHVLSGSIGKRIPSYSLQHSYENIQNDTVSFIGNNMLSSFSVTLPHEIGLMINGSVGTSVHGGVDKNSDRNLNYSLAASITKKIQLKNNVLDMRLNSALQQSWLYDYNREYLGPVLLDYEFFKRNYSYLVNVTSQISFKKIRYMQSLQFNRSDIDQQSFRDIYSTTDISTTIGKQGLQLTGNIGYSLSDEILYSFRATSLINVIKNIKINAMLEYGKQRFFWPDVHYENGFMGNVSLHVTL